MGMSQRKMSRVSERVKQFDRASGDRVRDDRASDSVSASSSGSFRRERRDREPLALPPTPLVKPPRKRLSKGPDWCEGAAPKSEDATTKDATVTTGQPTVKNEDATPKTDQVGKLRRSEPLLSLKEATDAKNDADFTQTVLRIDEALPTVKSCHNFSTSSEDDAKNAVLERKKVKSDYDIVRSSAKYNGTPITTPTPPLVPKPSPSSESASPPPTSPSVRSFASASSVVTIKEESTDQPSQANVETKIIRNPLLNIRNSPQNGDVRPNVAQLTSVTTSAPLPFIDESSAPSDSPTSPTKPRFGRQSSLRKHTIGDRDYIGFATLPEQIHRKSVKRGFDFTLMVVGESGLGKSTLVNSLFLSDLYKDRIIPNVAEKVERTTTIERKTMDIEERGVKLRLTVVDTPGFGDALNCDDSWRVVVNYIDDQFRQYFTDESGLNRKNIQDNRVHCCLYFIPPYGHGLRQIDVELMKRLHQKVNIVPVIGKADALTLPEVKKLKQRILDDIAENGIQIYQFPECDSDEDEEFKQQDRELKASLPFSVIGSNTVIEVGGTRTRGRQYPWGVVEVENPKHSDFNKLRNMLITTHMQDLKDVTEDVHYENFRAQCISQISQQAFRERGPNCNHLQPDEERKHVRVLKPLRKPSNVEKTEGKLKRDSVPPNMDPTMITETDRLLLQKDEEIRRMQDMLAQMQQKLKATTHSNDNIVNI